MTHALDPDNMFGAIHDFSSNMLDAVEIGKKADLKQFDTPIRNIVLAGMGGSAIGGDVNRVLLKNQLSIPFVVSRHYGLPNWVNENTLVICSSYSGNTEETLSATDQALDVGAQIVGISTGGQITEKLNGAGKDVVKIPSGLQPRAALAFSFIPMLYILHKYGLINHNWETDLISSIPFLKNMTALYCQDNDLNPAYGMAQKIHSKIPIIYGESEGTSVVALRYKGQFCENAKMPAYHNELPELNHNEIVGWEKNESLFKDMVLLWLKDEDDHTRVKYRQTISENILKDLSLNQETIQCSGSNRLERFLHMIHYGDWLSYWCAIAHGVDPSPVVKISKLKNELEALT
ncbi:MAG: bifunctional phosphoglucose/phosphomannose isomerase [Candidatus Marinimicrobia bacterium]|nr:bifunctional phosphoglucose/phosphomannose isomerase [Candidatus Neomarinimicrobiota bacterium]